LIETDFGSVTQTIDLSTGKKFGGYRCLGPGVPLEDPSEKKAGATPADSGTSVSSKNSRNRGAFSVYFDCLFAAAAPSGQVEDSETLLATPRKGGAIRQAYVVRFPYLISENTAFKLEVPAGKRIGKRYMKVAIDQGLGKSPQIMYVKLWFNGAADEVSSTSDSPYAGVAESEYLQTSTAGRNVGDKEAEYQLAWQTRSAMDTSFPRGEYSYPVYTKKELAGKTEAQKQSYARQRLARLDKCEPLKKSISADPNASEIAKEFVKTYDEAQAYLGPMAKIPGGRGSSKTILSGKGN